ncbi:MAG: glycosyltransferase family 4 protein [Gammaproteobacteria bacterium]|nr:glycosyltransferase family 4 protein [Gammaproteobacteria bacterium]
MRVAFYAPMKAPTDPVPSGDRKIARLFFRVLNDAGHEVQLVSRFRSWEGAGDGARQQRLRDIGGRLAERLLRRYRTRPAKHWPEAWFTYHLYHKAPDWLGPRVSRSLGIPYVIAEASYAPKQAGGSWVIGHQAAGAAISQAAAIVALNSSDIPGVLPLLNCPRRLVPLKPFLDTSEYPPPDHLGRERVALRRRFGLDTKRPLLLTVAMMRYGNKLSCYQMLGRALKLMTDHRVTLLIVGDGPARAQVEAAFAGISHHQIVFAGLQSHDMLKNFYAAADLFVWPAVDEPMGMALLEAQAAGLAVVAGDSRGVPDIVRHRVSGLLVSPGDAQAFAHAVVSLLENPLRLREMRAAARALAMCEHDIATAVAKLNGVLEHVRQGALP